jgi:hypothetical protein
MVLIAAAVVLGLFLLRALDDSTPSGVTIAPETGDAAVDDADASPPTTAGGGDETTTTETPARPVGEVTVRVANSSGVQGAARAKTEELAFTGYKTAPETNGPESLEATQVLYVEGFEAEARALAETLGAPADGVGPLPDPPPVDPAGAQLVVLLGTDLAGG